MKLKHLILSMLALLASVNALADAVEIDGIWYNLVSKAKVAEVTSTPDNYIYIGAVNIPEKVTYNGVDYDVTSIGGAAFKNSNVTSITIPNSMTSIGEYAFSGCSKLTSIDIPNNVTTIEFLTFEDCYNLVSVTIPNSVTKISSAAFLNCRSLSSIDIPNSVTRIANQVFQGCTNLTSVTISNNVTSIEQGTFDGCSRLTSITIPNSVTDISYSAFRGCSSLASIIIPNSVRSIRDNAFYGCSSLTSITIGNGIESIKSKAFANCPNLTDVYCYAENVPSTTNNAFEESYIDYATLHVPAISIEAYCTTAPWSGFGTIVAIEDEINNIVFADANVKAICVANWDTDGDGELSEAEAAAVTDLGEVFKDNTTITSFNEMQYFTGLTSIGDQAFRDCSGLTSITIPGSVTKICNQVFQNCHGLATITIPNSVTEIQGYTFENCTGLTSITIPNSVTSIYIYAFVGCSGLTSITVESGNTVYDSRNGCNAIIETATNTLHTGCQNTIIPNSVTSIGSDAFSGCTGLTSITIPGSVTSIGIRAFEGCSGLTSITIPNRVTSIGWCAFQDCSGLTSITIPGSVTSIEGSAFSRCSGLTSIKVEAGNTTYDSRGNCNAIIETATNTLIAGCKNTTIPGTVTSIGDGAFSGCSGLTSVTIPNSVTSIGITAFQGCFGLTSVTIPSSVTSIGYSAFSGCSGLTSITIPGSVTSIGDYVFASCSGLTSVTIPNSVTSIGWGAFQDCWSLTDVFCYAKNVPTTGDNIFEGSPIATATLHVPAASLKAYSTTEPWNGFGTFVIVAEIINGIEDLSKLSNTKQYLIHTRGQLRGTLGVVDHHLASTNPTAYGPYVCRPIQLDKSNPLITNVSQLSSPNTEPTQGSLDAMIDGDNSSFWHSTWSEGNVENGQHYFQVTLNKRNNIDVAFQVRRRDTEKDHITEWGVYGTNTANATKANCTLLAVIETPYNNWGETRVSDIFKTGGYKYLRFYINNTTHGRGYGHLAEFQLYPATTDETRADASPFAIIQKKGGYYLYSVLDKAFITPVKDGDESTNPSNCKMNIYNRDNHFVFDFVETSSTLTINVNYEPGIAINTYGTAEGKFDDGNLLIIEEVGDFDPTEALALFYTNIDDNMSSFSIAAEESEKGVKYTRNFDGKWEALYLPFAIDYNIIKDNFDLAEIDGVVQNDENYDGTPDITVLSILGFKGQQTEPNKPYLIRAKNAGKQTITFEDVTIYPTEELTFDCASFSTKYEFMGIYKKINSTVTLKNRYIVQDGELVKGASKLPPFRWHMTATSRNGAPLNLPNKIRIMPVEDVITGVSPLGETEEGAVIYNLAGQRLSKPQQGINIQNGKKILIK